MTSYMINARKKSYRKKHNNKFSYAYRFYFTSAKIVRSDDDHEKDDDIDSLNEAAKKVTAGGFLSTAQLAMLQENESRKSIGEINHDQPMPFDNTSELHGSQSAIPFLGE